MITKIDSEILDWYRAKTKKISGNSLEEKLSILRKKWIKVIEDCKASLDKSNFRIEHQDVHEEFIRLITNLDLSPAENLNIAYNKAVLYFEEPNIIEAVCYILVELEMCYE